MSWNCRQFPTCLPLALMVTLDIKSAENLIVADGGFSRRSNSVIKNHISGLIFPPFFNKTLFSEKIPLFLEPTNPLESSLFCIFVITVVFENTLLPHPHGDGHKMTARVKGPGCLHKAPASVLTMLREFQKNDDKIFGGKTIRIVKHDRLDAQGKEVSGCFVWIDVVAAVLPQERWWQ